MHSVRLGGRATAAQPFGKVINVVILQQVVLVSRAQLRTQGIMLALSLQGQASLCCSECLRTIEKFCRLCLHPAAASATP